MGWRQAAKDGWLTHIYKESMSDAGWEKLNQLLMDTLNEYKKQVSALTEELNSLKVQVAILQTKAAFWGAGAGIIAGAIITLLIKYL